MPRPSRGVGRPPGPHEETLAKLLPAALRLFLDEGGQALTPTRLHKASGVARATIYRNWPDPADLIEIMLERATESMPESAYTGEWQRDLYTAAESLVFRFEHRPARAFFAACLEYGRRSERVACSAEAFAAGILEPFHRAIAAGIACGELDGDEHELVSAVSGPLMLEHVILGKTVSAQRGRDVVERFIAHHCG